MAFPGKNAFASWDCDIVMIIVRLFGALREEHGESRLEVEAGSVGEAIIKVAITDAEEKLLRSCVIFVNNRPLRGMNRLKAKLRDGDELALLPPVSGG